MGFLSRLGLISQVQPAAPATDWEAKYKTAITDLAEYADDFKELKVEFDALLVKYSDAMKEIAALRPDAEKWRDRAARELQRGQAKRDAAAKGTK